MSRTMNRQELIASVADESNLNQADATRAVNAVFTAIEGALKKQMEVRLVGFGTFQVAQRKASRGRNPRTGEEIGIPASASVRFRAGKTLKDAVN